MSTLLRSHIEEGDEVIIIEPSFDSYAPVVKSCGGVVRYIPLRLVNCHKILFIQLELFCKNTLT